MQKQKLVLFHCPHDGDRFPAELMRSVCIPRAEFGRYHDEMRDLSVSLLIPDAPPCKKIVFPVSRLLCDPERFIGPCEIMEKYGMGFCYERAYDGRRIKRVTPELLKDTRVYYDRHHALLDGAVEECGEVLLIDLHSYHDRIVPQDFSEPGRAFPDVCIGTDPHFTPPELKNRAKALFEGAGLTVAENYPYSGTFVPNAVMSGHACCRLSSVMLELHRRSYLRRDGTLSERAGVIRGIIAELCRYRF